MGEDKNRKQRRLRRVGDIPYCPKHGFQMYVGSTTRCIQYYYCPDPECKCSDKRVVHAK